MMQVTLKIHVPKGVSAKDKKIVKQIEKLVLPDFIKIVNAKFGNKVELTKNYKTKKEIIDPSKLTIVQKRKLFRQIMSRYNDQTINLYQYWSEIIAFNLHTQASTTKTQAIKYQRKAKRDLENVRLRR